MIYLLFTLTYEAASGIVVGIVLFLPAYKGN